MKIDKFTILLWSFFIFSLMLYQFGFGVTVPFANDSLPLSTIFSSMNWNAVFRIHNTHDFFTVFVIGGLIALAYPCATTMKQRSILLALAVILPMLLITIVLGGIMFISPISIFHQFTGRHDGETYSEDMDQACAAGFWMLGCFLILLHHLFLLYKLRKNRKALWSAEASEA